MFNSGSKVNPKQKTILFKAMSQNRHVLERQSTDLLLRRSKNALWEKLAAQLNMYGPEKDIGQWKKCWRDLRLGMRKKYLKAKKYRKGKYFWDDYERLVIRACGVQFSEDEESGELQNAVDDEEIIETLSVESSCNTFEDDAEQDQHDGEVPREFEMINVSSVEINNEEDLMRGTIKIEDVPLSPVEIISEADSLFLSGESVNHGHSQATIASSVQATARNDFQDETLSEIRRMHRNLLKESKKQTALLRKLLNRLTN